MTISRVTRVQSGDTDVELAIGREDVGPAFRAFLADLVQRKKLV